MRLMTFEGEGPPSIGMIRSGGDCSGAGATRAGRPRNDGPLDGRVGRTGPDALKEVRTPTLVVDRDGAMRNIKRVGRESTNVERVVPATSRRMSRPRPRPVP